jgi:hypothetical protein
MIKSGLMLFGVLILTFCVAAASPVAESFSWSGERQGGLPEGRGIATFADGRVYAGEMAVGLFIGKGTLSLPDGIRYTGDFVEGKFQGQGVYTFANGDRYIGEFDGGKLHGAGIYRPVGAEERYRVEYVNGTRVRFELEVQAAELKQEAALSGVIPEMLRRVARLDTYIRRTLQLQPTYTSGLRDETKNLVAGGVLHSFHLQGKAVDLVVPGITSVQETLVVRFANQQGLGALWHGVGDNYHLHLQLADE